MLVPCKSNDSLSFEFVKPSLLATGDLLVIILPYHRSAKERHTPCVGSSIGLYVGTPAVADEAMPIFDIDPLLEKSKK
jgi:hypothetical protein